MIHVTDPADPRIADYSGVKQPARLVEEGLFVAEGRFVVRRLLATHPTRVRSLLLSASAFAGLSDALANSAITAEVIVATPNVVEAVTGFNLHRGCLALAERPDQRPLDSLPATPLVVVLERVTDADNVGSVFRSAEAFGADLVVLSLGCADPLYRKAIRTSAGSTFAVPFVSATSWPETLSLLRAQGLVVAALTPDIATHEIGAFVQTGAARGPIALLLGTEGHGLSNDALALADVRIRIPMGGTLDSLNIATAAGIALHRLHDVRRHP